MKKALVLLFGAWLGMQAQAEECSDLPAPGPATPNHWAEPSEIQSQSMANAAYPPEISRIRSGVVSYFEGGFINDGMMTWYAYDAERELFIAVLGNAGRRLLKNSDLRLGPNQLLRTTIAAGYQRSEFVTIVAADSRQVAEMSCLTKLLRAA